MKQEFFGIMFASLQNLWVIFFIGGIIGLVMWAAYKRKTIIAFLASSQWRSLLLKGYSPSKELLRIVLWCIGLVSLGIVFLQPQWDKKENVVEQYGRDVIFALDISRSMLAQDLEPNRLHVAKKKIKALIKLLQSERVGLLLFAGSAIVQCPLTTDHHAFFAFLDQIDSDTVSTSGTSIAQALDKALTIFNDLSGKKTKMIVVVTDGEDFSENLLDIKERAKQQGVIIAALGVGTKQGAPIPLIDHEGNMQGYQKEDDGSVVFSKLDESLLQDIVKAVDGLYVTLQPESSDDIEKISGFIETFEKDRFEDKTVSGLYDKYPYFAAIAFGAFLMEWFL